MTTRWPNITLRHKVTYSEPRVTKVDPCISFTITTTIFNQLKFSSMCDTTWIGGVMWVNYLKKQCILILIQYLTLYCINLHIFTKQSCTEVLILQNIKIVYVWPKNTNHVCQHSFINLLGKIVLSIKVTILKVSLEQQKTFCS